MKIDFTKIPSPCYILHEELLKFNLEILQLVQNEAKADIICALKGFAFWETFPLINKYLKGAAASSLNEAKLINEKMGVKAHTYCPAIVNDEIEEIASNSSYITFNSISQYKKYINTVKNINPDISCGLRINPEYSEIQTKLYNTAQPGSRLGVTANMLDDTLPEGIDGLHFHSLCENDSFALERTLQETENSFSNLIKQAKWFNMGGGHLITSRDYDIKHLVGLLQNFQSRYPNLEKLILEPGEAIGWQTGYLLATVVDIIENKGIKTAMLNVSFASHMPDCLEMPYKPHIIGASEPADNDNMHIYKMGGNTCLAGDYMGMGDYSFEKPLEIGDNIIFDDMMHYTMVKSNFFNGVKHPSIGIWQNSEFKLLKTFGYEDYKNKLS